MLIDKGKTDRCPKSYELTDEVWSAHSRWSHDGQKVLSLRQCNTGHKRGYRKSRLDFLHILLCTLSCDLDVPPASNVYAF